MNLELQKNIFESFVKSLPGTKDISELVVIQKLLNPTTCSDFINEILFEAFNVETVYHVSPQEAILKADLQTRTATKGILSVDLGYSFTEICPVFNDNFVNTNSLRRSSVGGKVIRRFFEKYQPNTFFTSQSHEQNLNKPFLCTSKFPNSSMLHGSKNKSVVLKTLPEDTYFYPEIIGLDEPGLPELISSAIDSCPFSVRESLKKNIVLTGGLPYINKVQSFLSYYLGPSYSVREVDLNFGISRKYIETENLLTPKDQIFSKVIGASNISLTDITSSLTRKEYLEGNLNR